MPSYLPPLSQRPQMISRLDLFETKERATQIEQKSAETGVLSPRSQHVERSPESSELRFPHESEVSQFRGDVTGRSLRQGHHPEQLSGLSERVAAFDQFRPIGPRLSSLGGLERIALGLDQSEDSSRTPILDGSSEEDDSSGSDRIQSKSSTDESKEAKSSNVEHQKPSGEALSQEEAKEVDRLIRRDAEVRQHEQAHVSAGGQHIRGGVSLQYTQAANGKRYATSGEVNIDLSSESTHQATISKMQQVKRAALAPAQPSGADRAVAAAAAQKEREARVLLAKEQSEALSTTRSHPHLKQNPTSKDESESSSQPLVEEEATPKTRGTQEQRSLKNHESYPLSSGHESYPLSSSKDHVE